MIINSWRSSLRCLLLTTMFFSVLGQADICGRCGKNTLLHGHCFNQDCPESVIQNIRVNRDNFSYHRCQNIYSEHSGSQLAVGSEAVVTGFEIMMGGLKIRCAEPIEKVFQPPFGRSDGYQFQSSALHPPQLRGLQRWQKKYDSVTSQDIINQLAKGHLKPQRMMVSGDINSFILQFFTPDQLVVIAFFHDEIEEHLFVQSNSVGQVFAFSDVEGFLETTQPIMDPLGLISGALADYDPTDVSNSVMVMRFLKNSGQPQ